MEIVYVNGKIVDAIVRSDKVMKTMTIDERVAVFGCAQPDPNVWAAACAVEDKTGTVAALADLMVSKGLMPQARGDAIKA